MANSSAPPLRRVRTHTVTPSLATLRLDSQAAKALLQHKTLARAPPAVRKWAPTAVGLCAIPFIIHPIDNAVDYAMDRTLRVWMAPKGGVPPASTGDTTGTSSSIGS
eukprot:TRINITY_DN106_c0_g1_i1.p6 TRINITY_DN106_c0_g1~~TRINITY_DN106_c0_g1_i1.p6  ORF type:complete len:107 (-),score=22.01 TRINITY_DN106_c0_g1_i1:201-521(-)